MQVDESVVFYCSRRKNEDVVNLNYFNQRRILWDHKFLEQGSS